MITKTQLETDFEVFDRAIARAKSNGYVVPPLEWAVLVKGSRYSGWSESIRMWAVGLLYTDEFLKGFFGERLMPKEEDRDAVYSIRMWAKQVAVELEGKLYDVRNCKNPNIVIPIYDEIDALSRKAIECAPAEIMNPRKVVVQLNDMVGSIALNTHKIDRVEVDDITLKVPAWKYHKVKMSSFENPFNYLRSHLASCERVK